MGERIGGGDSQNIQEYYQKLKADGKIDQKDLQKLAKAAMADGQLDEQDKQVLRDIATTQKLEKFNLKPLPKEVQAQFKQIRTDVSDPATLAKLKGNMQTAIDNSSARTTYNNTRTEDVGKEELFPQLYGRASQEPGSGGVEGLDVTPEQREHRLEVYAKVAAANGWTTPQQMKEHTYEIIFLATVVEAMERSGAQPGPYNPDGSINKTAVRQYYDKHQDDPMPQQPGDNSIGSGYSLKLMAHYYGARASADSIDTSSQDGPGGTNKTSWTYTDEDGNGQQLYVMAETGPSTPYHPIPGDPRTDTYHPHHVYISDSAGEGHDDTGRRVTYPIEFPVNWK